MPRVSYRRADDQGSPRTALRLPERAVDRALLAACASLVTFLAFVYSGVPILPKQSDSAWYFSGARYLESGTFVWESTYPSFHGPSQYYPLGGYGLILFLIRALASGRGSGR